MIINGFKIKKRLGAGKCGVAYLLDDNRVLKITDDLNEAKVAQRIKEKNIPNVNYIYDVWMFKKDIKELFPKYYILQDRLEKLSWRKSLIEGYYSKNEITIQELINHQNFQVFLKKNNFNLTLNTDINDLLLILNFCCCWKNLELRKDTFEQVEEFIKYFKKEKEQKLEKLKKVYEAIKLLKKEFNIDVCDCHQDNMMKKDGNIYLIDILSNNNIYEKIKII
jgi:hypothetical protein